MVAYNRGRKIASLTRSELRHVPVWGHSCKDRRAARSKPSAAWQSGTSAAQRLLSVTEVSEVTLPSSRPSPKLLLMQFSRAHLAIALGSAGLLVLVCLGYLYWLSNQPPVLSRSEERDPLTQMPISITMNPFRDRTIERTANRFISEMRDGNCRKLLAQWEKDYRKKRAAFLCNSEAQHPLISWNLVEWEDAPPLVILHYKGQRYSSSSRDATYKDLFSVTEEKKDEGWTVTKYDSFY